MSRSAEEEEGGSRYTFNGVRGLVLAAVAEHLIFDPRHVVGVVLVVLVLGPFHGSGHCYYL